MPSLIATTGHSVDLPFKKVVIGWDPFCDVPLKRNRGIACQHVTLDVTPQGTVLHAPDPKALVIVNGIAQTTVALRNGDILTLGEVSFTFRSPPQAAAPQVQTTGTHVEGLAQPPKLVSPELGATVTKLQVTTAPGGDPQYDDKQATQAIRGGYLVMVLCLIFTAFGVVWHHYEKPVKEQDLLYIEKRLVSSEWVDGHEGNDTLLTTPGGERFVLPRDTQFDVSQVPGPIQARMGVIAAEYVPSYNNQSSAPRLITLEVDHKILRTLAQNNTVREENVRNSGYTLLGFGLVVGSVLSFSGYRKRRRLREEEAARAANGRAVR